MNQVELTRRVRALTRDLTDSIFRDADIYDFINEGIERVAQLIPEMREMPTLKSRLQEVSHLPKPYRHLLALYGASRCFTQDERHYQAGNMMNEFEIKMTELKVEIEQGSIVIYDENGKRVYPNADVDYVVDNYFARHNRDRDFGVNGVE